MKLLIFGATGFIGSQIVKDALAQNFDVKILAHNSNTDIKNVEVIKGDVLNPEDVLKAVQGVDVVVNLIGIIKEKPPVVTFENMHVRATKHILDALEILDHKPLYIHISAFSSKILK